MTNNMYCNNEYAPEYHDGYGCSNNSCLGGFGLGGNFSCIINLIIILIVLQFLTSIIAGPGCGNRCCDDDC